MENTIRNFEGRLVLVRALPAPLSKAEQLKRSIKNVGPGDCLSLDGEFFFIEEKSRYKEGSSQWFELRLVSLLAGEIVFLEWEEDDEIEISLWRGARSKLCDLNLTAGDLRRFDDEERGSFMYQGLVYTYDESDEAIWFQGNVPNAKGRKLYYWDFSQRDGRRLISVERWGDEYEVCFGSRVDPRLIVVIAQAKA